jgi:hypothetical protein
VPFLPVSSVATEVTVLPLSLLTTELMECDGYHMPVLAGECDLAGLAARCWIAMYSVDRDTVE